MCAGFAGPMALSVMISPQLIALAFLHLAGPASPLLNSLSLAPEAGSANPMLGRGGIILVLGLHHAPLVAIVVIGLATERFTKNLWSERKSSERPKLVSLRDEALIRLYANTGARLSEVGNLLVTESRPTVSGPSSGSSSTPRSGVPW